LQAGNPKKKKKKASHKARKAEKELKSQSKRTLHLSTAILLCLKWWCWKFADHCCWAAAHKGYF
jgi:hypothetical protein